jgi:hypothetical protein
MTHSHYCLWGAYCVRDVATIHNDNGFNCCDALGSYGPVIQNFADLGGGVGGGDGASPLGMNTMQSTMMRIEAAMTPPTIRAVRIFGLSMFDARCLIDKKDECC